MVDRYHSWQEPLVARQMGELALRHLGQPDWETHRPFAAFLASLDHVSGSTFLDMGCGVGHYSEILQRKHPGRFEYTGADFSVAMIEEARKLWPGRNFIVADALTFDYGPYDVVMASSVVEVMEDWQAGVEALCKTATGQILLHRVRICDRATHCRDTTGYGPQPTYTWTHNERELLASFAEKGFKPAWSECWNEGLKMVTYIFEGA